MAMSNNYERGADSTIRAERRSNRRFLQFSVGQSVLFLSLCGVLLGILTPRIHRTLRMWRLESNSLGIASANEQLIAAIRTNNVSLARRAFEAGASPDLLDGLQGQDRVFSTCIKKGHVEMVKLFLEFGVDADEMSHAILVAADCDQPPEVRCQLIRLLVAAGANPRRQEGQNNAMDLVVRISDGQTGALLREYGLPYGPREMAAFNRLEELKQAVHDDPGLLKQRFRDNWATNGKQDEPTLLAIALRSGYREMSLFLIGAGAPLDPRQHLGRTLLHEAAIGGDSVLVRLLLDRGLDVNAIDDHFKDTPLEYARGDAVDALLEAGADVNHQDVGGRTRLHAAVLGNRSEVIEKLMAAGADPTIADMKGDTPFDVARAQNPAMVDLLERLTHPPAEK